MELAYKAFNKDLTCTKGSGTFQYEPNKWFEEPEANCIKNGFHCALNPLDCLNYYPNIKNSVYWQVIADGDIDEDGRDSKISCTRLYLCHQLSLVEFVKEALYYIQRHPEMPDSNYVMKGRGEVMEGEYFTIVRGKTPIAKGVIGSVVGFAEEKIGSKIIDYLSVIKIDGIQFRPDTWYYADGSVAPTHDEKARTT